MVLVPGRSDRYWMVSGVVVALTLIASSCTSDTAADQILAESGSSSEEETSGSESTNSEAELDPELQELISCSLEDFPADGEVDFVQIDLLASRFGGMVVVTQSLSGESEIDSSEEYLDLPVVELAEGFRVAREGEVVLPEGESLSDVSGPIRVVFDKYVWDAVKAFSASGEFGEIALNLLPSDAFGIPFVNSAFVREGDGLRVLSPCANQGPQESLDASLEQARSDGLGGDAFELLAGPLREIYLDPDRVSVEQPDEPGPGELASNGSWEELAAAVETGRPLGSTAICIHQDEQSKLCSMDNALDGRLVVFHAQIDEGRPLVLEFVSVDTAGSLAEVLGAVELDVSTLLVQRAEDDTGAPTPGSVVRLKPDRTIDVLPN